MSNLNNKEANSSTCLKWASIAFIIVIAITLFSTISFIINMNAHQQKYSEKYDILLKKIKEDIRVQQNSQSQGSAIHPINFRKISEYKNEDNYQKFLANYYSTQSNWLNVWLTILAITLGVMGIAIPILIADKRKDFDENVENAKKTIIDKLKLESEKQFKEYKKDTDDKLEQMRETLKEVEEFKNKAEISEKKTEANTFFAMGFRAKNENKLNEAIDNYTKAIELNPAFAGAYNNRGAIYADQKKYDSAINDYNKAINLNPAFAGAYNNRGAIYADQKKYDLATADYNKAIDLNPDYAEAYHNRGILYKDQKKYDLAINDYNKAINLNPAFAEAYNNRGAIYAEQKKYDLATTDYNKAIDLNPDFAGAYYNLAEAYIFNKQFDKALKELKVFQNKESKPYIYEDDYTEWNKVLNEFSETSDDVQEIKKIIETFTKKKR